MQRQILLFLFLLLSIFLLELLEAMKIKKVPNYKGKGNALKVKGKAIEKNSGIFGQKNVKKGADKNIIAGLMGLNKSANVKYPDHSEASHEAIAGLLQLQKQPNFVNSPSRNQSITPMQIAEHEATLVKEVATPEYPPGFEPMPKLHISSIKHEHDAPTSLLPHMENIVFRQHLLDQEKEERLQFKKLINALPPLLSAPQ